MGWKSKSIIKLVWQKIYQIYAIRSNVEIGKNIYLGIGTILSAPNQLILGSNIYIGKYCTIECDGEIGDYVLIGNMVGLIGRYDHDYRIIEKPIRDADWIGNLEYQGLGLDKKIVVESDSWIGYGTIVLSGVTIGRGAIIGAGSVVTTNIPPYSIAVGVPAKVTGKRFSDEEICEHELKIYGKIL